MLYMTNGLARVSYACDIFGLLVERAALSDRHGTSPSFVTIANLGMQIV